MSQPRLAPLAILGLATVTAAGFALQQYRRAEALAAELAAQTAAAETATAKLAATTTPTASPQADHTLAPAEESSAPDDFDGPPDESPDSRRDRRANRPNPAR